ncbi:MAG: universal stress protein [Actinomycetota bacterium]|nr:universal stress protein [Actinomycetota bacterium]
MTQPQERIVVGVDGSSASIDALKWAIRQASLTGAVMEAVIGWQYPTVYGGYPLADTTDWPSNAKGILDTAVDEAIGAGNTQIARKVVEGHPAQVLMDAAAGAGLLVVGSRGHGGFTGMLLGSVSAHVATHAPCPVLVVRHATQD